jgi:hypothetical protein
VLQAVEIEWFRLFRGIFVSQAFLDSVPFCFRSLDLQISKYFVFIIIPAFSAHMWLRLGKKQERKETEREDT